MPESPSARLGLIGPSGTDPVADGDDQINAIITQLESAGVGYKQGTSRPSPSSALQGFFYVHTGTGQVSYCTGSTWLDLQMADGDLSLYAAAINPAAQLGLNDGTTVRRGHWFGPGAGFTASTAYDWLGDDVPYIDLPAGGLLRIGYQATWKESVQNAARAAIFLNGVQLKAARGEVGPINQEAAINNYADKYVPLSTGRAGLFCRVSSGVTAYSGDVTTGQIIGQADSATGLPWDGGFVEVFADPGTYDVTVMFKVSSGTVTVKDRRLYVEAIGF